MCVLLLAQVDVNAEIFDRCEVRGHSTGDSLPLRISDGEAGHHGQWRSDSRGNDLARVQSEPCEGTEGGEPSCLLLLHCGGMWTASDGGEIICVCIDDSGVQIYLLIWRKVFCFVKVGVPGINPFEEDVVEGHPQQTAGTLTLSDATMGDES